MQSYTNKKSGVETTEHSAQKGRQVSMQFKDNRPEALAQKEIQDQADQHGTAAPLKTILQMAGNSHLPVQMKTDIKYDAPQKFTFGDVTDYVGTKVEANLDPKDPIVGSDTGGSEQDELMEQLPKATTWKKGHLLNHDLGGRAIVWNLFPITTAANGEHYHEVEKIVKNWLGNGKEATYTVRAVADNLGDKTNANGRFECTASVITTDDEDPFKGQHINKTIYSHVPEQSWNRKYSKKKDETKKAFGSVGYNGDDDQVKRDQVGKNMKTLQNWDHHSGNQDLNRIAKDKSKGVRYSTDKGKVNIDEIEQDAIEEEVNNDTGANQEVVPRTGDPEIFSNEYDSETVKESILDYDDENVQILLNTSELRFSEATCSRVSVFYEAGLSDYKDLLRSKNSEAYDFYREQLLRNYELLEKTGSEAFEVVLNAIQFLDTNHAHSPGKWVAVYLLNNHIRAIKEKKAHLHAIVSSLG